MKKFPVYKILQCAITIPFCVVFALSVHTSTFSIPIPVLFLFWAWMIGAACFLLCDAFTLVRLLSSLSEAEHCAGLDRLTNLPDPSSLQDRLSTYSGTVLKDDISCITISFENIHTLNHTYGRHVGDILFREFADILSDAAPDGCFLARKSGRKFLAVIDGNSYERSVALLQNLEKEVSIHNGTAGFLPIQYRTGAAYNAECRFVSIYDLVIASGIRG